MITWDYPKPGKEASGVYFIGFLKGKVPQILRTRLAPNENIKIPFGRWASLRKASSKGPASHQWHICASQDIRGPYFLLTMDAGVPQEGSVQKRKNLRLQCPFTQRLHGEAPKTSRTVFLSPVEQSLAVHIPKWRWLLSTDTFRRAAALEVGPQASSACYMQTDSRGLCGCQGPPLAVRGRWSSAACCSASQPQSLFGAVVLKEALNRCSM